MLKHPRLCPPAVLLLTWFFSVQAAIGQPPQCPVMEADVVVSDGGVDTGFQDSFFGHFNRGRSTVAADFDLDGWIDFYIGNPGDGSFVIENDLEVSGTFIPASEDLIFAGELPWGAAAADYDNDGDYDLFISNGGNECYGFDRLMRNDSSASEIVFVDVSEEAGIRGPSPPTGGGPEALASGNGVWGDFNNDGWIDLFVNGNDAVRCTDDPPPGAGYNTLWQNLGPDEDGIVRFSDVTGASGLRGPGGNSHQAPSRHSTFVDIDNDGDLDLYEQNTKDDNILWRNNLGDSPTFEDVTSQVSGGLLKHSYGSFASCAGDFDNNGYEDIIVFTRHVESIDPQGEDDEGHALFLNQGGMTFVNAATEAGLNDGFVDEGDGVMGCQIGDLNGDGVLDVFMGNGGPRGGAANQLFLSDAAAPMQPSYDNRTNLIDCEAPADPTLPAWIYPPYPYRTHGTTMTDVDNDGVLEMMVNNGGPSSEGDEVREPNRMFEFAWTNSFNWFKVRPIGNGTTVSMDAIGTKLALTVSDGGDPSTERTIYRRLYGGSCFSAQNGFYVYFGLGNADTIESLQIEWPDGTTEVAMGFTVNNAVEVMR